jgi:glycosyltransferase involved in cell wall biosynthesis
MRSHSGQVFEVIQISDARSVCKGYNRGFAKTRGDIIIFCHDDIEIISPDFPARLLAHLRPHDVVGVAGTTQLIGANWNIRDEIRCGQDRSVDAAADQLADRAILRAGGHDCIPSGDDARAERRRLTLRSDRSHKPALTFP